MRKPIVHWFGRFDQPDSEHLLMFDFGLGPMLGSYAAGRFQCMKDPKQNWDRVLINKWRYCEPVEQPSSGQRVAA